MINFYTILEKSKQPLKPKYTRSLKNFLLDYPEILTSNNLLAYFRYPWFYPRFIKIIFEGAREVTTPEETSAFAAVMKKDKLVYFAPCMNKKVLEGTIGVLIGALRPQTTEDGNAEAVEFDLSYQAEYPHYQNTSYRDYVETIRFPETSRTAENRRSFDILESMLTPRAQFNARQREAERTNARQREAEHVNTMATVAQF